ncbi:MAG: serine/threonine protein kinase [Myxococcales bacterium]|nr:serine/threonine protein kinase [Myxococcales bacterium]
MDLVVENQLLAGKYRVERVLGEGGMGVVVRAIHTQLEQPVALKFLQPEALKRPALVARFAREAKALARLTTEHVARVIDVGTLDSGAPYIVMEYLDGEDLAALLDRRGRLTIEEAATYLLQACEAIAEAHAARIVHRDLKPANLFLARQRDGGSIIKVLDFGIAKALDDGAALTKTSAGLGSAHYMAPEQMRNAKSCDERADLWACGVILFELTTGLVPFEGDSVHEVVAAVIEQRRHSVHELLPNAPQALAALVDRCLQVDPAKRVPSVLELAEGLASLADGPEQRASLGKIRRVLATAAGPVSSAEEEEMIRSREEIANASTMAMPSSDATQSGPQRAVRDVPSTLPARASQRPGAGARAGWAPSTLGAGALLLGLAGVGLGYTVSNKPPRAGGVVATPSAATAATAATSAVATSTTAATTTAATPPAASAPAKAPDPPPSATTATTAPTAGHPTHATPKHTAAPVASAAPPPMVTAAPAVTVVPTMGIK